MPELIDEGFQYSVYDLGDKVRKEPKSRKEMIEYSRSWGSSEKEAKRDTEKGLKRRRKVQERLKGRKFDCVADYRFEGEIIIQENVEVTREALESAGSLEERKAIIDDHVNLTKKLWKWGMHDMSYNFTVNTGFDSEGRMVQLDLGDLIFSFNRVGKEVENRKWEEDSWSLQEHLEGETADYYLKKMREEINVEELERIWNEKGQ